VCVPQVLPERLPTVFLDLRRGAFRLGDDLERLARVTAAGAPEAMVFYAARILEAVVGIEAEVLTGEAPPTIFASLQRLDECGQVGYTQLTWFHTLRALGNAVRHVRRALRPHEAELGLGLLERLLVWHFVWFPLGPRLSNAADSLRAIVIDEDLQELLSNLEQPHLTLTPHELRQLDPECRAPFCAALVAQRLIAGQRYGEARGLLKELLTVDPENVRLRQLNALALRRLGRRDEAEAILRGLVDDGAGDEETLGILGGLYKRDFAAAVQKHAAAVARKSLEECARCYAAAWKMGGRTSGYVGVNVAATQLWAGRSEEARKTADRVLALFEKRRGKLAPEGAIAFKNFYDHATLAEATLLAGREDEARQLYLDALEAHPADLDGHRSALEQLELTLRQNGRMQSAREFLGGPMPSGRSA
jgi:tetratricopeptide (TPR) repeat protein